MILWKTHTFGLYVETIAEEMHQEGNFIDLSEQ
jgi:hypothetical protein